MASHEAEHDSGPTAYELHLICSAGEKGTYWASREDYEAHLLSIDYSLSNTGTGTAYNVEVTEASANRGVTVATPLPLSLGDLDPGDLIYFTLRWLVPSGVGSFTTDITACADDKEDDEEDQEELDDDKPVPPGDGGQLNNPPGQDTDDSINTRLTQNNLSQYEIVHSALPSTGYKGFNATVLMVAIMISGFFLTLLAVAGSNGRRR